LTIQATLCFIVRDGKVLLLKKSAGLIGEGKWNAPGGKMLEGEEAKDCAVREVLEETQVTIRDPDHLGILYFYKDDRRDSPEWTVNVFLARDFDGTPTSGREGIVSWFSLDALPFDEMWEDDPYWSRLVFEGRRFEGWFYYTGDFAKLVEYKIEEKSTPVIV
jgi:8-oxo-dGTP diphosphatase